MRLLIAVVLLFSSTLIYCLWSCHDKKPTDPLKAIHSIVNNRLDSFDQWLDHEWLPLAAGNDSTRLRQSFLKGHRLYKTTEWALEYFFPATAKSLNGAPLPEIEAEEHTVIEATGLQVIEELLFPFYDTASRKDLLRHSKQLKSLSVRAKNLWPGVQFRSDQVFDALRLELYRVSTLGITGFDLPQSLQSIPEVASSLHSIEEVIALYDHNENVADLIRQTIVYTQQSPGFNAFDRMHFISTYINPLSSSLIALQKQLNIPVLTGISALRGDVATLFDENAFDVNYFTPDQNSWLSPEKIALGKKLFYDPVLSNNNRTSCASCHKPERAFTDGLPKSRATGSNGFLQRNTPTLINAGYQHAQFYDLRAAYLEDQVKEVVHNKDEIHGSLDKASEKLSADSGYISLFKNAFPSLNSIQPVYIQVALASYVRSLSGFNSRFDQHMRNKKNLTADEIAGFNLFMGKAKCATCHFMPLFNGTVPPSFTTSESEVLGIPGDAGNKKKDTDKGRYLVHQISEFESAFKTPGLRNIALTAPYMHNGVYQTLEEVMDFYNRGGGKGLGFPMTYQTLPETPPGLTKREIAQVISFLKTLTDTTAVLF